MSVPTASREGTFAHLVKTPVKAVGSCTENERAENPTPGAADEHRQGSREVGERQRENCSHNGT